ncbi:MAG: helix-turn-helix transcriptional regulator, partial [Dolichospermum sp.]
PRINESIAAKISEAIKACKLVDVVYKSHFENAAKVRRLAPYGLLSGYRRYLVAHDPESSRAGTIKTYRMDSISDVVVTDRFFIRPDDFDLQAFANRGFALFQRDT